MTRTRPSRPARRRSASTGVVRLGLLLITAVALVAAACTPTAPTEPPPPYPPDLAYMDDAQLDQALQDLTPRIKAGYEDKRLLGEIPREHLPAIDRMVRLLETADGRAVLAKELRDATAETKRGLPLRDTTIFPAEFAEMAGLPESTQTDPPLGAERTPPPSDTGGVSVPLGTAAGVCGAPDGEGSVVAPAGVRPGQLLTPTHDVFTQSSTGVATGQPGPISPTGQEPVPGGGPGIELRASGVNTQQMKVRVHLSDPKGFGPRGLYAMIRLRPLDGDASDEVRATIVEPKLHCYAGDTDASRGYLEGWISIPRREPGFQVIAEVVENDWYWAQPGPFGLPRDLLLAATGPQYFAGADRSTIHVGAPAVTSAAAIPRSVGAFATSAPDPARGVPNVLTETNGEVSDDVEVAFKRFVFSTVRSKVQGALAGDILQLYALTVQANPTSDVRSTAELSYVPVPTGQGEPAGTSALRADVTAGIDVDLFVQLLGVPCTAITASIDVDMTAHIWAGSGGNDTSLAPEHTKSVSADANFDMPYWAWLDPVCAAAWLAGPPVAEYFIEDSIESGLDSGLGFTIKAECLLNGLPNWTPVGPPPDRCLEPGTLQKLLRGFDLNDYLPTMSLGGATFKPVVTDIDNAWCRTTLTAPPPGCTPDQNLFGDQGVEITGDAAMVGSLGDALGAPLGGRFRNVFSPTIKGSVEDVVTTHRDIDGRMAGLGVVVDPRQVNLLLRHLAQGGSTNRTTNGLLDITGVTIPVVNWGVTVRPESAPMVLGVADPGPIVVDPNDPPAPPSMPNQRNVPVVLPDLRMEVRTGPTGPPITFSVSAKLGAGAGFDASTGKLKPILSVPQIDLQVIDGCQADYVNAYALSYAMCGRGTGGTGGPESLTDLLSYVANSLVLPAMAKSIGGISLPDLAGIVPGLDVALANVRSDQRGGHVAVYADLRPVPRIGMAISPNQPSEPPSLRFFPSAFYNIDVVNIPTTYTWEVRDAATNQLVATTPVQGAESSAVRAPLEAFTELTDEGGGTYKRATAKLTVRQVNLELSVEGTYTWRPPSLQPPTCGGGPGTGTFRMAPGADAAESGGGVAVQLAPPTPPPGCP